MHILIDGKAYQVREGDNLLSAALEHGLNLPYFCWHPALGSVGACRQCAVTHYKDEKDQRGRLVMACMTPVSEGARFSLNDNGSREFRSGVIEWLMLNHPHDCPVCDEGGECHLQDMTVMTGHVYRRSRLPKRTYRSQELGPFIHHEMNRCVTCYRCVRFYRDYAGGRDLQGFASKDQVYFGRHEDGSLESPFSGNLVEVCPTGVFTDKTFSRHYTRKWDLQSAPSLCVHCGLGCNIFAAERYASLRRIANRYHHQINGYFLCDRGRFGYEFVNGPTRIRTPWIRTLRDGPKETSEAEAALQHVVARLEGKRLVGIGSPRASLESNYALRRLVGEENFYSGLHGREDRLAGSTLHCLRQVSTWSLREVEECDVLLVLGENVEATNPRLALALRQATRNRSLERAREIGIPPWQDVSVRDATQGLRSPLFVLSPLPTALDELARHALRLTPDAIVSLGEAIARRISGKENKGGSAKGRGLVADEIAETLLAARRIAVIAGAVEGNEAILLAASHIVEQLSLVGREAGLVVTAPECNTLGAALLGGAPLEKLPTGPEVAYLVVENDLFRRAPEQTLREKLHEAGFVVTLDIQESMTTEMADAVLPACAFAESGGVYVNNEGRAQRAFQVFMAAQPLWESWRWLGAIGAMMERSPEWGSETELFAAAAEEIAALREAYGIVKEPIPAAWRIGRQSFRYSGRTAMVADETMHEPPPPIDGDTPYSFSMEGYGEPVPARLAPRYWAPGWNSYQAVQHYQREIGGPLRGGESGVRLFHPGEERHDARSEEVRSASPRWLAVPIHRLFGSEELSTRAPAIAARTEEPFAALHPDDAATMGLHEGEWLEISQGERRWRLPLKGWPMARGVVAVSDGVSPYLEFHRPVNIARV